MQVGLMFCLNLQMQGGKIVGPQRGAMPILAPPLFTANQNSLSFKDTEHLKRQTTTLQQAYNKQCSQPLVWTLI